ncbi:hypothetical protein ES703_31413 [subsurface metagenome]
MSLQISLKLSPEVLEKLDGLAKEEMSSRSRLIKIAITNFLKENANPKTKNRS